MKESIYSPELAARLFQAGLDFEEQFNKKAQEANPDLPDIQLSAAKKMVAKLLSEIDPKGHPKPANIQGDDNSQLTTANLTNLGNLVQFLADKHITVNGRRIAAFYHQDGANNDETAQRLLQDKSENVIRLPSINGQIQDKPTGKDLQTYNLYLAFLPDLLVYLQNLQVKAESNTTLKVILGNLVTQLKQYNPTKFGQLQGKKSDPNEKGSGSTNGTLDQFDNPTLTDEDQKGSDSAPEFVGNGIKLMEKDLGSGPAFHSWVEQNKIVPPDNDLCRLLQIMYRRSLVYKQKSNDPKFTKYGQLLVNLGSVIQGPDGKACNVASGLTSGNGSGTNGKDDGKRNGKDGSGNDPNSKDKGDGSGNGDRRGGNGGGSFDGKFDEMIRRFPLDRRYISLTALPEFNNYVMQSVLPYLFANNTGARAQCQTAFMASNQYVNSADNLLISPGTSIPLGQSGTIVSAMLKNRNGGNNELMNLLDNALANFYSAISMIYNHHKNQMNEAQGNAFQGEEHLFAQNQNAINDYRASSKATTLTSTAMVKLIQRLAK